MSDHSCEVCYNPIPEPIPENCPHCGIHLLLFRQVGKALHGGPQPSTRPSIPPSVVPPLVVPPLGVPPLGETQSEKMDRLSKLHTENLKQITAGQKILNERTLKRTEARVTFRHTYPMGDDNNDCEIQCKVGYNTVKPYISSVPKLPSSAQDTLWGDLKKGVTG